MKVTSVAEASPEEVVRFIESLPGPGQFFLFWTGTFRHLGKAAHEAWYLGLPAEAKLRITQHISRLAKAVGYEEFRAILELAGHAMPKEGA